MMRVSGIKAFTVAAVIAAGTLLLTPRCAVAGYDLPGYCCVCSSCSAGARLQCVTVMATGSEAAAYANHCVTKGCQFLEVLDGSCSLSAATCTPASAPAASLPVLVSLGTLLAGGGIYLARRRRAVAPERN